MQQQGRSRAATRAERGQEGGGGEGGHEHARPLRFLPVQRCLAQAAKEKLQCLREAGLWHPPLALPELLRQCHKELRREHPHTRLAHIWKTIQTHKGEAAAAAQKEFVDVLWPALSNLPAVQDRVRDPEAYQAFIAEKRDAWLDDAATTMGSLLEEEGPPPIQGLTPGPAPTPAPFGRQRRQRQRRDQRQRQRKRAPSADLARACATVKKGKRKVRDQAAEIEAKRRKAAGYGKAVVSCFDRWVNIAILQKKWPGVFALNRKRQNEVLMNWNRRGKGMTDHGDPVKKKRGGAAKARRPAAGECRGLGAAAKKKLAKAFPSTAIAQRTGKDGAEYIMKRCKRCHGRSVEQCLGMRFVDAKGAQRIYGKNDLRYDLSRGHLKLSRGGATRQ